jgi:hypothetical protein
MSISYSDSRLGNGVKKIFFCTLILSAVSSFQANSEIMSSFPIGSTAPDIHIVTSSGDKVSLSSYFGNKRIVLFFVPNSCEHEAQGYLEHLSKLGSALEERDLQIIVFLPDGASMLKRDFGKNIIITSQSDYVPAAVSSNGDGAPLFVLIGKDQSIKLREPQFVQDKALFATIDAMPMRKAEAKKKQGKISQNREAK